MWGPFLHICSHSSSSVFVPCRWGSVATDAIKRLIIVAWKRNSETESFVFTTSDLHCSQISLSHEQMPLNGTASQATSTALHSPLAAVEDKEMQILLFQWSEQNRDLRQ